MKNYPDHLSAGTSRTGISLQALIGHLVYCSLHNDTLSANSVINEVPEGFIIINDESRLRPVINDLLATTLMNARNGDIHITAERFNDMATLLIQDRNCYNSYAVASRLHCIAPDAHRLGGHIDHIGMSQLVSTISFSFPACCFKCKSQKAKVKSQK